MKEENKIIGNQEDKKGIERLLEQAGKDRVIEGVVQGEGKVIVPDKKIIVPSDVGYGDPILCTFGDYQRAAYFDRVEEGFLFLSISKYKKLIDPWKSSLPDLIKKLTKRSMHKVNKRNFNDLIMRYTHGIVEIRFRAGKRQIGFLTKVGENFVDLSEGYLLGTKNPYHPSITVKTNGAEFLVAYNHPKK